MGGAVRRYHMLTPSNLLKCSNLAAVLDLTRGQALALTSRLWLLGYASDLKFLQLSGTWADTNPTNVSRLGAHLMY